MDNLTPKQKKFCDYYLESGNASEAYRRAYPDCKDSKSSNGNASRLISNDSVKRYLEERMGQIESDRIAKPQEILEFLTSIMRGEVKDQLGLDASLQDRIKATDSLIKRYPKLDSNYILQSEKLKLEKAKLLLEIEKLKGNTGSNDLADTVKEKMSKRKKKNE